MESRLPPRWLPRQPLPARDVPLDESYWRRLRTDWWDSGTRGWFVPLHVLFDGAGGAATAALAASMTGVTPFVAAVLGLAGAAGGFAVLMGLLFIPYAVRTPFRQRNEARSMLEGSGRQSPREGNRQRFSNLVNIGDDLKKMLLATSTGSSGLDEWEPRVKVGYWSGDARSALEEQAPEHLAPSVVSPRNGV